ncbi:hypothetical protein STEG23_036133, partial [Scotinomys teguina]
SAADPQARSLKSSLKLRPQTAKELVISTAETVTALKPESIQEFCFHNEAKRTTNNSQTFLEGPEVNMCFNSGTHIPSGR